MYAVHRTAVDLIAPTANDDYNMSEEGTASVNARHAKPPAAPKLPPTATPESRRSLEAQGGITPWVCELCNIVFGSAQVST